MQHQLLATIKGHPGPRLPSIREIADYLLLQSHSAVELVNRAEAAGVARRSPDPHDTRVVRVELTEKGDKLVTELTTAHLARLYELAAALNDLILPADSGSPAR
jgi:DNA-binding MarR family transcriptional regulator